MLVKNQSSERSKKMNELKKFCADCKTTRTPLWRSGPAGPRVKDSLTSQLPVLSSSSSFFPRLWALGCVMIII